MQRASGAHWRIPPKGTLKKSREFCGLAVAGARCCSRPPKHRPAIEHAHTMAIERGYAASGTSSAQPVSAGSCPCRPSFGRRLDLSACWGLRERPKPEAGVPWRRNRNGHRPPSPSGEPGEYRMRLRRVFGFRAVGAHPWGHPVSGNRLMRRPVTRVTHHDASSHYSYARACISVKIGKCVTTRHASPMRH